MGIFSIFRRGARRRPADPHTAMLDAMNRKYSFGQEERRVLEAQISTVSPETAGECALFLSKASDDTFSNKVAYLELALKHAGQRTVLLKAVMDSYEYLCEIGLTPVHMTVIRALDVLAEHEALSLQQQRALLKLEMSRFAKSDFSSENFHFEFTEYRKFIYDAVTSAPHEVERIIELVRTTRVAHGEHLEELLNGTAVIPLAAGEL
jgi:hypothetical protein